MRQLLHDRKLTCLPTTAPEFSSTAISAPARLRTPMARRSTLSTSLSVSCASLKMGFLYLNPGLSLIPFNQANWRFSSARCSPLRAARAHRLRHQFSIYSITDRSGENQTSPKQKKKNWKNMMASHGYDTRRSFFSPPSSC